MQLHHQLQILLKKDETNLFRGLSKLLKYRFVKESRADVSYSLPLTY